jgi:hypothetical protein
LWKKNEGGKSSKNGAFSILFHLSLFKLGSIDEFENVRCLIVVECWGMNEHVHHAIHLTKMSKNLLEVLVILPLF